MRAIKESYLTELTDEFQELLTKAMQKLRPFVNEETPKSGVMYYKDNGDDYGGEYDTCDDDECIEKCKTQIRADFGKNAKIEHSFTIFGLDENENIERCCICSKPLTDHLTWCVDELESIEQFDLNAKFIKENSFVIYSIFDSQPTRDCEIDDWAKHEQEFYKAVERREEFFKRVVKLAQTVLGTELIKDQEKWAD